MNRPGPNAETGTRALERVFSAIHPAVSIDGRLASAEFVPEPEHRGNPGWLHGGMAATVLDHVCARCASAQLGTKVVTGRLDLRYRRPVPLAGGPYRVRAEADAPRRRTVRIAGAILDGEGRPLVEAHALFVTL